MSPSLTSRLLRAAIALLVVFGLFTLPVEAAAQEEAPQWALGISYERQAHPGSETTDWSDWRVRLRREGAGTVVLLSGHRANRMGETDHALSADGYLDVGSRAYVHLNARWTPDRRFLARSVLGASATVSPMEAWEGSLGYRFMEYPSADVHMVRLGAARYLPGWYVSLTGHVLVAPTRSAFVQGRARAYIHGPDGYVEGTAGAGRELIDLAINGEPLIRASRSVGLRVRLPVTTGLIAVGSAGFYRVDGLPDRLASSLGLSVAW